MLVLITYDVAISHKDGARRLRKVAKVCKNYGQRVQNSVFECVVDSLQLQKLKAQIQEIIDYDHDSVRYYNLGKSGQQKVVHVGAKPSFDVEDVLIV